MGVSNIRDYLKQIVGDNEVLLFAEVTEVDGVFCTVQPIDETLAKIENVRLVAEESDSGFYPIPKVGSQVIVTLLGGTSAFVSMFGELESLALRGDQYGGLVKIEDLVTKLNNLENKVNSIINTYNTHTHSANNTPTTSLIVGTLTTTQKSDLENTKILHG